MMTILALVGATLRYATPLALASLGGIFSERSGVVNIALEGIMLIGAWSAVYFTLLTGSPIIGLVGAAFAGVLTALLHAVACVHLKANQVVSGVAINLLAAGFTQYMANLVWKGGQSPIIPDRLPDLWGLNLMTYVALLAIPIVYYLLWRTPWGLRLRSVGEHPKAADTVGVDVYKMRYWGVLLSGLFAGVAGASLSVGLGAQFLLNMTNGRGFIALAAMIFGRWNPWGALLACMLFGVSDAMSTLFQIYGVNVPSQFLAMAPYLLTMLALAGFVGRAVSPAALSSPYHKSH